MVVITETAINGNITNLLIVSVTVNVMDSEKVK